MLYAKRGARFLSAVIFKAGGWRGSTRFRLFDVVFEMGGWRGQLVGNLVTVLIFKYIVLFCVLRQNFGGLQTVPVRNPANILQTGKTLQKILHLF